MTVFDVRCDLCGTFLAGPAGPGHETGPYGVGFSYHPGDAVRRDDSGLMCGTCWETTRVWLGGQRRPGRCARDGTPVAVDASLHVQRAGELAAWQLCRSHAVEFLNRLRTVEPKLEEADFTLAADWPQSENNT